MNERALPLSHLFFLPELRWARIQLGKPEGFDEHEVSRELHDLGIEAKLDFLLKKPTFAKAVERKTGISFSGKGFWLFHPEAPGEKPALSEEGPVFRDNLVRVVRYLEKKGFQPRVFHATSNGELHVWHPTGIQAALARIGQLFR